MIKILSGLFEQFWESFFPPTIKLNFPPQTVDGEEPGLLALTYGDIVEMTPRRIVFEDDSGNKLTLKGHFYLEPENRLVEGGDIAGTIKGFSVEDDGTEVASSHGFKIDAAYFFMAVDQYGADAGLEMFYEDVEVYKGSEYGDMLYVEGRTAAPAIAEAVPEPDHVIIAKGLAGDDTLIGGEGVQVLKGGKDSDTLFGGYDDDRDILIGGEDGDFFIIGGGRRLDISRIDEETPEVDHIKDFSSEEDTIVFAGELRGGPVPEIAEAARSGQTGFIGEEQFHQGHMATTEDHRFIYNKWTGELFLDLDGNNEEFGQSLIATFKPGTHVEASDIYVGDGLLLVT